MQTLNLKKTLPDAEADKLLGKLLGADSFDYLLQEDADVMDAETGEYLVRFRRGVLDGQACRVAYHSLRSAAAHTDNRGMAAGEIPETDVIVRGTENVIIGDRSRMRYRQAKPDGTLSNTNRAVTVQSGIIGFFDRNPRIPFCRQTAFNVQNGDKFSDALPFIQSISRQFQNLMPERWAAQKAVVDKVSPDFIIPGTVFSTITVNKNWQTACHRDAGDLKAGFGVMTALRAGRFDGCYLCFPQYRVAVDMQSTDILLADVHQLHGNSPIRGISPRYERLSMVFYLREKMKNCGSAAEELERAKRRVAGTKL